MPFNFQVLFEKEGVFIHTTVAKADEDALVEGKIFLFEKVGLLFCIVMFSPVNLGFPVLSCY